MGNKMSFRLKVQFKIVVKLAYCVSNINFPAAHSQRSFFGKTKFYDELLNSLHKNRNRRPRRQVMRKHKII